MVSESLDRRLPAPERLKLRVHFLMCVLCRRFDRQMRFMRQVIRRHSERLEGQELPPPPGLSAEARDRQHPTAGDHQGLRAKCELHFCREFSGNDQSAHGGSTDR